MPLPDNYRLPRSSSPSSSCGYLPRSRIRPSNQDMRKQETKEEQTPRPRREAGAKRREWRTAPGLSGFYFSGHSVCVATHFLGLRWQQERRAPSLSYDSS